MKEKDELIACFIDGTATETECYAIRQYLQTHPEERESILHLMDMNASEYLNWNVEDELNARFICQRGTKELLADMATSAAICYPFSFTIASMIGKIITPKEENFWGNHLDSKDLDDRWNELCEECFGD